MTTSKMEEDELRRETLRNDLRVGQQQEQGGTFFSHTHSDLGGRYAQIQPENVLGSTANPYGSLPPMPEGKPQPPAPDTKQSSTVIGNQCSTRKLEIMTCQLG